MCGWDNIYEIHTDTVLAQIVDTNTNASIRNKTVESLLLLLQSLRRAVDLFQIAQITLDPLDAGRIPVFAQLVLRQARVVLFIRQQQNAGGAPLEQLGDDAEADPRGPAGDEKHFAREVGHLGERPGRRGEERGHVCL